MLRETFRIHFSASSNGWDDVPARPHHPVPPSHLPDGREIIDCAMMLQYCQRSSVGRTSTYPRANTLPAIIDVGIKWQFGVITGFGFNQRMSSAQPRVLRISSIARLCRYVAPRGVADHIPEHESLCWRLSPARSNQSPSDSCPSRLLRIECFL